MVENQSITKVKIINWNIEKNELLKLERNISFEDIVIEILNDNILETNIY